MGHAQDDRACQGQLAIAQGYQQDTPKQLIPQQAPQFITKQFIQGSSLPPSDGRHPKTPDRRDRDIPGLAPG